MNTTPNEVAIVGTTSWGTTLGLLLSRTGMKVNILARTTEEAATITSDNENKRHLPGFPFPPTLSTTASLDDALGNANLIILATPSQHIRHHAELIKEYIDSSKIIINVAKGLEIESAKRMSQVISEEIADEFHSNICTLSGPNLAKEIAKGLPAAAVIAAYTETVAAKAQKIMATPLFRVYVNTDLIGVELGGVLKNIIALSAGMVDGLGYGNNAKAGLITRGLAEITRLGVAAGATPLTFAGLAGLGDLVATCSSPLSRNRHVGQELAHGRSLDDIRATMIGIAEGVTSTVAAIKLAEELNVEMPIANAVYHVLYNNKNVEQGVAELMGRELKHEYADIQNSAINHP